MDVVVAGESLCLLKLNLLTGKLTVEEKALPHSCSEKFSECPALCRKHRPCDLMIGQPAEMASLITVIFSILYGFFSLFYLYL